MKDDHGFASMAEYLEAVKRASETGEVDPRLKPIEERPGDWHEETSRRLRELERSESTTLPLILLALLLSAGVYLFAKG